MLKQVPGEITARASSICILLCVCTCVGSWRDQLVGPQRTEAPPQRYTHRSREGAQGLGKAGETEGEAAEEGPGTAQELVVTRGQYEHTHALSDTYKNEDVASKKYFEKQKKPYSYLAQNVLGKHFSMPHSEYPVSYRISTTQPRCSEYVFINSLLIVMVTSVLLLK